MISKMKQKQINFLQQDKHVTVNPDPTEESK
jgi:hypothetical protein